MRIFKYPLQPAAKTAVQVPDGTRFRSVDWQGEQLVVWAEVPEESPTVVVATLEAVMTGGEVPPDADYIGTAQHPTLLAGGPFVVHVYLLR